MHKRSDIFCVLTVGHRQNRQKSPFAPFVGFVGSLPGGLPKFMPFPPGSFGGSDAAVTWRSDGPQSRPSRRAASRNPRARRRRRPLHAEEVRIIGTLQVCRPAAGRPTEVACSSTSTPFPISRYRAARRDALNATTVVPWNIFRWSTSLGARLCERPNISVAPRARDGRAAPAGPSGGHGEV